MHIRRPLSVFCLLFAMAVTALLIILNEGRQLGRKDTSLNGRHLSFEGTLKGIEEKNDRLVLQIGSTSVSDSNLLLYLNQYTQIRDKLHIGSKIQAEGKFVLFEEAHNKGQFDSRIYYGSRGYDYAVYEGRILGVSASYDHIRDGLYRLKESTGQVYEHYFDKDEYGIIDALVLADRSKMDKDMKERYKNAGISHILALSALHIATLGFMLLGLLRKMHLPVPADAVISVTVMFLYCIMTGMPVSAIRAMIMFVLSAAAMLAGRTYDLKTASAAAAFIMLIINPDHIFDAGFILSFASVLGIGVVYPPLRELILHLFDKERVRSLHRSHKRVVRLVMSILRAIVFYASLQLSVMPVTMWFFYQLPTYGIFVNLIVVPLAGMLLFSAVAVGIAGNVLSCLGGTIFNPDILVKPFVYITKRILWLYDRMTVITCSLPGSILITGRPKIWQISVYYAVLMMMVGGGHILCMGERRMKHRVNRKYLKHRAAVFLALFAVSLPVLFIRQQPRFELSALDVGQGQCFVIHGKDVPAIIYDCGSTDEKDVGEYRLIPFLKYNGISKVDTVFVSHLDSDHVNGVIGFISEENSGISVGRIIIPASAAQRDSENYPDLMNAAKERGIPVYTMSSEDSITWEHLSAICLSPDAAYKDTDNDINEGSLVLSIGYSKGDDALKDAADFRALFTGDISTGTEEILLEHLKGCAYGYDYLQVAHHGSKNSACKAFIDRISPSVALISAGENNSYGHPHKETLRILDERPDTHTYITFKNGETDCDVEDGDMRIFLFK